MPIHEYSLLFILLWWLLGTAITLLYISQKNKKEASEIIKNAEKEAENIVSRAESSAQASKKEIEESRNEVRERKKTVSEQ